ncbi:MAG TPA: hypothetical protein DEP63_04230 [Candidatus Magasanikbacteria bacterium]|nr:hypothetical protein [Candidatus Magasanikbacteria bacterium]HCC13929.1 hypothetical protein [Candidatus Magasanikbacteria bacterium]HCM54033.1 hypothetical protein [Candidatus Magasanikbacteria bacterium]
MNEVQFTQLCAAYERIEFAKLISRIGIRLVAYSVACLHVYVAVVHQDSGAFGKLCLSTEVTGCIDLFLGLLWFEAGTIVVLRVCIEDMREQMAQKK